MIVSLNTHRGYVRLNSIDGNIFFFSFRQFLTNGVLPFARNSDQEISFRIIMYAFAMHIPISFLSDDSDSYPNPHMKWDLKVTRPVRPNSWAFSSRNQNKLRPSFEPIFRLNSTTTASVYGDKSRIRLERRYCEMRAVPVLVTY